MALLRGPNGWPRILLALIALNLLGTALLPPVPTLVFVQAQETKFIPTGGSTDDPLGDSVALRGDTLVAGAHKDDTLAPDAGAAYVFVHAGSTWAQQAKLTVSDGAAGTAVALADIQDALELTPRDLLALAQASLETHLGQQAAHPEFVPFAIQERLNLGTARALLEISYETSDDELSKIVALAKLGTLHQARSLGHAVPAVSSLSPGHELPSEAALAIAKRHGVQPAPIQVDQLRALDGMEAPLSSALRDLFNAYLSFEGAAWAAYASAHPDVRHVPEEPTTGARAPAPSPRAPGTSADLGAVLGARTELLDAVVALEAALDGTPPPAWAGDRVDLCPALALDLAGRDTSYLDHCALILDLGGDDVYRNNAGGGGVKVPGFADSPYPLGAALVDLGHGKDRYGDSGAPGACGVNGGGCGGAGFLLDAGGDDVYVASNTATNGGGFLGGLGFLLDAGGDDVYLAGHDATNGGGEAGGAGLLVDGGGDDAYRAQCCGTNGGSLLGMGLLLDHGGNDEYTEIETFPGFPLVGTGVNGGTIGGRGFLVDFGGDDTYTGGPAGVNGGGIAGAGFLLDAGGDDAYRALDSATNGGGIVGAGVLLDLSGDDTYTAGRDGVNGGGGGVVAPGIHVPGVGLLFDQSGRDVYEDHEGGSGVDCTVAPKGVAGAQADAPRLVPCGGDVR